MFACGLLVGDLHGRLPDDASVPVEATIEPDVVSPTDAGTSPDDATVPENDAADAGTGFADGPGACNSDFDSDTHNCGWCAHDCQGASCTASACEGQTAFAAAASSLFVEGTVLYVNGAPNNSIVGYDPGSGQTQTIATAQAGSGHIFARAPYVVWTTSDGNIHRALEDGGASTVVWTNMPAPCVAANATRIYWWDNATGKAYSVPIDSDGGAMPVVEYSAGAGSAGCLNADDHTLAILLTVTLVERDLDAGTTTTVVLPGSALGRPLLAGRYTVVAPTINDDAGATMHVELVTTGTNTLRDVANFPQSTVLGFAADDAGIYWALQGTSRIDGCSDLFCTAGVRHFSPNLSPNPPGPIALDPTFVYAIKSGTTSILKFAR